MQRLQHFYLILLQALCAAFSIILLSSPAHSQNDISARSTASGENSSNFSSTGTLITNDSQGNEKLLLAQTAGSQVTSSGVDRRAVEWREIEPGYAIARIDLGTTAYLISSELLVARIDPKRFELRLVHATDFKQPLLNMDTITKLSSGFLGINTHFFDPKGQPLGLLVRDGKIEHRLQQGGSVLTGIFTLNRGVPKILHRSEFSAKVAPELALQAGPRLLEQGKPVPLKAQASTSRRSGIAVTRAGEVLLFATFLRFPGATLEQIQEFLLRPELEVVDALNLDGGGSSQFFVVSNEAIEGDIFISGGDPIPVGLVVKKIPANSK